MKLLVEQFGEFLESLPGQSPANRHNYRRRLKSFLDQHGDKAAESITAADVNSWHEMLRQRGYAEATMAGYRQALKSFLRYCRGPDSPAAHLRTGSFVSKKQKLPPETAVSRAESQARAWLESESPRLVRDGLIFLLSLESGPRIREIQELRKSEVEASLARGPDQHGIYRATSTGKTKEVVIRFGGDVAAAFRRWLELRPKGAAIDRCFVTTRPTATAADPTERYRPLSRSAATKAYQRLAAAAGLKKPILSHALRHRLGDRLTEEHSAKVAAITLNHRDWQTAATAIAYYHHPDEDDVSRAVAALAGSPAPPELLEMARLFGIHDY